MDPKNTHTRLSVKLMFDLIKDYHDKCVYPQKNYHLYQDDIAIALKQTDSIRFVTAIMVELGELLESFPWKPWRPAFYQPIDMDNMKEELVDILFFVGAFMEIWDIQPEELVDRFWQKLKENKERLENGYSKRPKS